MAGDSLCMHLYIRQQEARKIFDVVEAISIYWNILRASLHEQLDIMYAALLCSLLRVS